MEKINDDDKDSDTKNVKNMNSENNGENILIESEVESVEPKDPRRIEIKN